MAYQERIALLNRTAQHVPPEYTKSPLVQALRVSTGGVVGDESSVHLLLPADQARDPNIRAYLERDTLVYRHLKYSEMLSNTVHGILEDQLKAEPRYQKVADNLEKDIDHGYTHFRRVEKWYKEFYARDPELRADDTSLEFAPSSYLSVRFHDLVEVGTDSKFMHDKIAALFAYCYLGKIQTQLDPEHWNELRHAVMWTCAYHSNPKTDMPNDARGYGVDPVELYRQVKKGLATKHISIQTFFPPFALVEDTLEELDRDSRLSHAKRHHKPHHFGERMEGLKRQTLLFVAADKLDSNIPASASAIRTLLTSKERPIYEPIDDVSIKDEIKKRRELGGGGKASTDKDRYTYEVFRIEEFEGISPVVSSLMRAALLEKAEFLGRAMPKAMVGDFSEFLSWYDTVTHNTIIALIKQWEGDNTLLPIEFFDKSDIIFHATNYMLKHYGHDRGKLLHFAGIVEQLELEQTELTIFLNLKFQKLSATILGEDNRKALAVRERNYWHMVTNLQRQEFLGYPPQNLHDLPYSTYYSLATSSSQATKFPPEKVYFRK